MPNHMHGIIVIVGPDDADDAGGGGGGVRAGSEPALTPAPTANEPAPTPAPTANEPTPPDAIPRSQKRHPLPEIVRQLKTFSARRINALRNTPGIPVWQRNYYEHIIRNETELQRIRQYIRQNPAYWAGDSENLPPLSTREATP